MATEHVDRATLVALPQRVLIQQVHVLRLFVRSLTLYPQEHPVLLEQADRLVGQLWALHRDHGALWIDASSHLLAINGCTVDRDVPELAESVELAVWLRERGVRSLLIGGVLLADDLLDVFGWLTATDPQDCRAAIAAGEGASTKGPLDINPPLVADPAVGSPVSALAAAVLEEVDHDQSDQAEPHEDEETVPGTMAFGGLTLDELAARLRQQAVEARMTGPFGPAGVLAAVLAGGDPLGTLVDDLADGSPGLDPASVERAVTSHAAGALVQLKAPELVDFLARQWPPDSAGASLRRALLVALRDTPALTLEVLGKLGNGIYGGTTGEASGPAIQVLETHVPWLLLAGQRREALRAVQILDRLVDDEGRTSSLRSRADIGLRRICQTDVVRGLLAQLKTASGGDPETEGLLYLMGVRSIPRLLEHLRDAQDKATRLDLVDVLTVVGRMAEAQDEGADRVLSPLVQILDTNSQAPWYLVRNVVLVLGNVGTPDMRRRLEARLREEQEPRVLSEITLGLMNSASPETLKVLGGNLLGGRLASPEAFQALLPGLLEHDEKGTFRGLENLLQGGSLGPQATRIALTTLAQVLGERSEPFLKRVLTARPLFRRGPVFDERVRASAVETLGALRGPWVERLLDLAAQDPSATIRDRVVDLRQEEAPTGIFRAVRDDPGD